MNERTERQLTAWLMEGPDRGPTEGLERVLALTRQTRQRPSWTFPERWIPMQLAIPRTGLVLPRAAVLLIVAIFLTLATLWIAGVGRGPRLPAPLGIAGNGLIADDAENRIWLMNSDGTARRSITPENEADADPIWSPDGTRLAFYAWPAASGPDASAGAGGRVGDNPDKPVGSVVVVPLAWSHDSKRVAFSYATTDGPAIDVYSIDGTKLATITHGDTPTWSPDDKTIAFRKQAVGVFVAASDGSQTPRRVSSQPGSSFAFALPQWSLDGRRIAYYSGFDGGHDIWVVGVDGSAEDAVSADPADEYWPIWSPDGQWIAFDHVVNNNNDVEFVVSRPDGTDARQLSTGPLGGWLGAWSPDGRYLVGHLGSDAGFDRTIFVDVANPSRSRLVHTTADWTGWQRVAP